MSKEFDVVVIGGGPGGYIAPSARPKLGFSTSPRTVEERQGRPEGRHPKRGLHPQQGAAAVERALFARGAHHFADHGIGLKDLGIDVKKMVARKDQVVKIVENNDGILYLFKRTRSPSNGRASFVKAAGRWLGSPSLVLPPRKRWWASRSSWPRARAPALPACRSTKRTC